MTSRGYEATSMPGTQEYLGYFGDYIPAGRIIDNRTPGLTGGPWELGVTLSICIFILYKLERYDEALDDCDKVIDANRRFAKERPDVPAPFSAVRRAGSGNRRPGAQGCTDRGRSVAPDETTAPATERRPV